MTIFLANPIPTHQDGVTYPDPVLVTPGTIGFLSTFLVAVAVVFLGRSLLRRQRKMRARAGVVVRSRLPVRRDDGQGFVEPESGEAAELPAQAHASGQPSAHSQPSAHAPSAASQLSADGDGIDQTGGGSR